MSYSFKHSLKPNHSNERPSHVLFADVESHLLDIGNNKTKFVPFLWTMIYKHYRNEDSKDTVKEYYGESIDDFWNIVELHCYSKSKTILTTHHLEVDFMPMQGFIQLRDRGWKLNKLIAHNRVLIMNYSKDKYKLIIMNNGNIFPGSIKDWGDTLGIPKLEMPDEDRPFNEWVTYCMRDTEVMVAMWDNFIAFLDEHDLGNFRLTLAGQALNSFRHRFMTKEIAIHNNDTVTKLERKSYHGGRFEALKIGNFTNSKFYLLDINSMYGWIQASFKLPYELRGYKDNPDIKEVYKRLKRYDLICECDIDTTEAFIPAKIDDKCKFQSGKFTAVLCTPELKYCLANGYIITIHNMAWYYHDYVMKEYANYFMDLKVKYTNEHNKPMRAIAKLFPNALYGKFAQHGYNDSIIGDCDEDEFSIIEGMSFPSHEKYTIAKYSGKVHQTITTDSGYNTFVSLSSHITAIGRMRLFELMKKAGIDNVYHVATDSLVVNEAGYNNLLSEIDETIPGMLKLEATYTNYIVRDVNDVIIDGIDKIKGIPKKAERINDNTYKITTWPRITTLLKQNNLEFYYTKSVTKTLKRKRYHAAMNISEPIAITNKIGITMYKHNHHLRTEQELELREALERCKQARIISIHAMFSLFNYKNNTFNKIRIDDTLYDSYKSLDKPFVYDGVSYSDGKSLLSAIRQQLINDINTKTVRAKLKDVISKELQGSIDANSQLTFL